MHLYCYILYNNYAITFKSDSFYRIICHKSQIFSTHGTQNLCTYSIIPLIGIKAQMDICLYCVVALLLQFVCFDFVHQTYAPTLLIQIDEYAFALFFYSAHGFLQLFAALAAFAAEYITRHTRRVYAAQDRFILRPLAFGQHDMLQSVAQFAERSKAEVTVLGRQFDSLAPFNQCACSRRPAVAFALLTVCNRMFQAIGYQILDGYDMQSELFRHFLQLRHTCHRSILVHYLDERSARLQACQPRQIDCRLGVSGTLQYAFRLGVQGIDMPRTSKGLRR